MADPRLHQQQVLELLLARPALAPPVSPPATQCCRAQHVCTTAPAPSVLRPQRCSGSSLWSLQPRAQLNFDTQRQAEPERSALSTWTSAPALLAPLHEVVTMASSHWSRGSPPRSHARPALLQPSSEVYCWRKGRHRSSPEQSRNPRWPPLRSHSKSPFCVPAQRSHGARPVVAAPAQPPHCPRYTRPPASPLLVFPHPRSAWRPGRPAV